MARPALSAARAVAVLNHLTAHPDESSTLTELSRELGVNPASIHAVLGTLEAAGYVVRDAKRKTYRLGPSLVALGQVALDQHPVVRRGREQAAQLAETFDVVALVILPVEAEFLITGVAGPPSGRDIRHAVGHRLPFLPPIGIMSAGYLDEAGREAWLDGLGPNATEAQRARYRDAALACRAQGYEIGLDTPSRQRILHVMMAIADDPLSPELGARLLELVAELGEEDHQLLRPEPGVEYRVDNLTAPIFGPRGEIAAGLSLIEFPTPLDADQIDKCVRLLVDSTTAITLATGGRIPVDAEG